MDFVSANFELWFVSELPRNSLWKHHVCMDEYVFAWVCVWTPIKCAHNNFRFIDSLYALVWILHGIALDLALFRSLSLCVSLFLPIWRCAMPKSWILSFNWILNMHTHSILCITSYRESTPPSHFRSTRIIKLVTIYVYRSGILFEHYICCIHKLIE